MSRDSEESGMMQQLQRLMCPLQSVPSHCADLLADMNGLPTYWFDLETSKAATGGEAAHAIRTLSLCLSIFDSSQVKQQLGCCIGLMWSVHTHAHTRRACSGVRKVPRTNASIK